MANKKESGNKEQFIVTWDNNDGDPVKVFNKIEDAKNFITVIMTGNQEKWESAMDDYSEVSDVDKASVRLYKGVLVGKPKVEVTFVEA